MARKSIKSWILNILFLLLLGFILWVPEAKALVLQGLMEIGLLPDADQIPAVQRQTDLSAIQFKDAKGSIINLEQFKGKVIFLNFWATWCPPCLAEMPSIAKFYQAYQNDPDIAFVMVEADGNFEKTNAFLKRKNYNFPVYTFYSDLPENIFDRSLPTTVVFDKQGRISMHHLGAANYNSKKFLDFIETLKKLEK